ncbi:autotransporter domain-containing protein [Neomegalonema sp.]|uniref:autotransporter domain-containing protein n=1 Tax=Neomegalonema sp. TaxID=2039713 RepID=UPI00262E1D66|nr:autotransporter domain-containing protein [Neomegalonema sp.]MDD2868969.1 autotransporter domain-containing protein [Neomegalonema sp.]
MIFRNRRAALMAGAALGLLAAQTQRPALAQSFETFVVFGDSLVDSGQRIDPGKVYPGFPVPLPDDARWRYTNREANGEYGQPYSGQLSLDLGFGPLHPSNPQTAPGMTAEGTGLNYGVGGALAGEVRAQIESTVTVPATPYYPATTTGPGFLVGPDAGLAKGSTLALVSAGGNDVRDMANVQFDPVTRAPTGFRLGAAQDVFESDLSVIQSNIVAEMGAAAAETAAGVRALRAAGVGLVIVPNTPNLAATPETALLDSQAPALAAGLGLTLPTDGAMSTPFATIRNGATQAYNGALNAALAGESGVMRVDLDGFFSAALANPGAFGFAPGVDHSKVCYNASEFTGVPCAADPTYGQNLAAGQTGNPLVLLFNDGIHPTTAAHGAIADLIGASLEAGPKVALAPHLPLRAARDLGDAFEDAAERGARIGGVSAFGSVGASVSDGEGPRGDAQSVQGHVGATKALSPSLTVGAGLGYHALGSDVSGVEIDGDAFMGGLFARHDDGRFFGTATLTAGYADVDVARDSRIGAAHARNEGSADGWVFGGAVQAGARLIQGPGFTAGPLARLEGWSASLGGYAEGGPGYAAQRYGDLDARSFRGGLGAFAEARGEHLGVRAEALFEHEFSDAQDVQVSSASLGGGWSAPGHALKDDGLKLGLTALYDAGFGLLGAGYVGRFGDDQSHGLRLGLSMPF